MPLQSWNAQNISLRFMESANIGAMLFVVEIFVSAFLLWIPRHCSFPMLFLPILRLRNIYSCDFHREFEICAMFRCKAIFVSIFHLRVSLIYLSHFVADDLFSFTSPNGVCFYYVFDYTIYSVLR